MIQFMSKYIDMLFNFVRPSQLLFIAIDGPPPRAKMMQQRERRFVKDYESKMAALEKSDAFSAADLGKGAAAREWDSNQITPGTPFMRRVADGLRAFIKKRLSDGVTPTLKVLLSDASVP